VNNDEEAEENSLKIHIAEEENEKLQEGMKWKLKSYHLDCYGAHIVELLIVDV